MSAFISELSTKNSNFVNIRLPVVFVVINQQRIKLDSHLQWDKLFDPQCWATLVHLWKTKIFSYTKNGLVLFNIEGQIACLIAGVNPALLNCYFGPGLSVKTRAPKWHFILRTTSRLFMRSLLTWQGPLNRSGLWCNTHFGVHVSALRPSPVPSCLCFIQM